jgi:hypothetical protein
MGTYTTTITRILELLEELGQQYEADSAAWQAVDEAVGAVVQACCGAPQQESGMPYQCAGYSPEDTRREMDDFRTESNHQHALDVQQAHAGRARC